MKYQLIFALCCAVAAGTRVQAAAETSRVSAGDQAYWVEQLAHGLKFPSSMAWLPNGDMLITERQGGLRTFRNGKLDPTPVRGTPASFQIGLNGLKDILLDPDYATNQTIYLALSEGDLDSNHAAIYCARYADGGLTDVRRIFRSKDDALGAGAAATRMLFLPDKTLLFGVPENNTYKARAQLLSSHMGKVVRINRDGSVPADNPFVNTPGALPEIWTYGNRETLGFYRDAVSGDVWVAESGPKGGDELNLLQAGKNYGWAKTSWGFDYTGVMAAPLQSAPGIEEPILVWTPSVTPSGLTRYHGHLYPSWDGDYFVGHLTARQLERLRIVDRRVILQERMLGDLDERIRDVKVGPDNHLYILTDNMDGRVLRLQPGKPRPNQLAGVARKLEPLPEPTPVAGAGLSPADTTPGDPVKGKQAFLERCAACHSVGSAIRGGNIGPDLAGVYGRNVGGSPGFAFSAAMAGSPQVWDERSLTLLMMDPGRYMPGTKMIAPPQADPEIRRQILGFLLQQSTKQEPAAEASIWRHDNLVAWLAAPPWDAKARSPEERARMLKRLGFKQFAYNWQPPAIPTFDAEVRALQSEGINLLAWALYGSDNPATQVILETFKRHGIHPQLWLMQTRRNEREGQTWAQIQEEDFPRSPEAQAQRVIEEADRIKKLADLAAPYGSTVDFYNHNAWFGEIDNELAIIRRLNELGVKNVGIVYNFSHARDELHDDSKNFAELWKKMQKYVVAVNITGMRMEGERIYPSQGDSELEMMRIIQESGWQGPVGVIAEKGGDAEETLKDYLKGLDWLAAELRQRGSAGPRPFPVVP